MAETRKYSGNSGAEDRFIELFCSTFGAEKGQYVYLQYPMVDIYGGHRSIDFALKMPDGRVAIEVDGTQFHRRGSNQGQRDQLKDSILEAIGLPLLRLSTNGSQEKEKIAQALSRANQLSASI